MASRTQLRLSQVTASFGDAEGKIVDNLAVAATLDAIPAGSGSMVSALSQFASAIQRIHGGTAFTTNAAGVFSHNIVPNSAGGADIGSTSAEWGDIFIGDGKKLSIGIGQEHRIIDGAPGLDIDSSEAISIGSSLANTSAINIGNVNQAKTITIGHDSSTKVDVNALGIELDSGATGIVINSAGGITQDSVALSIDSTDTTNLTMTANAASTKTMTISATNSNNTSDGSTVLAIDASKTHSSATATINLGTSAGTAINIGNATSEVTIGDNLTVTGDLTVSGDTTTVNTTNLSIEDSIIGVGFSGSNPSPNGDRAILFGRAVVGAKIPGLFFNGTDFKLASTTTDIASGSIEGTPVAADFNTFRAGKIQSENTTEATTTTDGALQTDGGLSVAKSAVIGDDLDLLSNSAILNIGSANKFTLTHQNSNNTATVSSGHRLAFGDAGEYISGDGTDLSVVSSGDIALNASGNDITLESGANTVGKIQLDNGNEGLIISASLNHAIVLDSNQGFIKLGQSVKDGGANGVAFVLGNKSLQVEQTDYDPGEGATAFKFVHNDTYGSQFLQISGSLRLHKSNGGATYVGVDVSNPASSYNLTLPDAAAESANEILVGDTSGNLSFKTQAELGISGTPSKAVRLVTGSAGLPAQAFVDLGAGFLTAGSNGINDLTLSDAQGASLDVFVNGQLLLSGTTSAIGGATPTADFAINSSGSIKFSFDLEADDVITVIKR